MVQTPSFYDLHNLDTPPAYTQDTRHIRRRNGSFPGTRRLFYGGSALLKMLRSYFHHSCPRTNYFPIVFLQIYSLGASIIPVTSGFVLTVPPIH
ncbi:hypothetical protein PLEOSDRAFT_161805 [Pleurotus ostreatus PC15]|uniref:Uncharacterized protein n=1 Tax=Pleurotus ostreatus (strain PC15) TaxID=1137138 RepID=A0A067NCZ9_PLEO1|nr:hypothetical protein PLEOSDRAFT_161805 [Pleurotus ostreatus PC15]